jgi:hypothetical protein
VFVFSPVRRQITAPAPEKQKSVFSAAESAGPGVTEIDEICAGE